MADSTKAKMFEELARHFADGTIALKPSYPELERGIADTFARPQVSQRRTIVIAGSYNEYECWRRNKGVSPHENRYVDREEQLCGIHGPNVRIVYTGRYYDSPVVRSPRLLMMKNEGAEVSYEPT